MTPSTGYQAIFRQILDSSIARDYVVRHVFEDLLKLADFRTGIVDMTAEAIARRTGAPQALIERALAELEAPDPLSRNRAEEGRRIVRLEPERPWGWRIVNFLAYREAARLEGKRSRQAAYRERKAGGIKRPRGRPRKPVMEGASRGDAQRRDAKSTPLEESVTEGKREMGNGIRKKEGTEPPSQLGGTELPREEVIDRLEREARAIGYADIFESFKTDELFRHVRDLMAERPSCFANVHAQHLDAIGNGAFPRGTWHDRRATLLWGRDPDSFHSGGSL